MKKNYTLFLILFIFLSINNVQAHAPALNFDGVNDYVQTTYSGVAGSADRTIEAWIRTNGNFVPGAGGGVQGVIVDYGSFVTGQRFTFNVLWGNAIRLEVGGNGVSGSIAVNDGTWHHVAVVYTSTGNNVKLYVDGVLDTQGSLTVSTNTGTSTNVTIGRRVDNINYFDGDIDEVRFYNFAKTQAQIAANMNSEFCTIPAGLTGYWKLNEGTPSSSNTGNTTAIDYSGSGNNGTLNGFGLTGNSSNWITGNLSSNANTSSSITASNCISYTSPSGNHTWMTTGTYTDTIPNSGGCDSIITVNLTIGSSFSNITSTACDSYISPLGNIYTTSGTYIDTLTSVGGCDSMVTVNLTVNYWAASYDTIMACNSAMVNGVLYLTSQDITFGTSTWQGCDSTVFTNLQITTIDTTVMVSDETITSNQAGADNYDWIDCATGMSMNETGSSFTATQNGSYAVIINLNNCTDTSECTSIMNVSNFNIELSADLQIIPNPNNGQFRVELEDVGAAENYIIYDIYGRVVATKTIQTNRFMINENLSSGVYFIIINTTKGKLSQKVMVN